MLYNYTYYLLHTTQLIAYVDAGAWRCLGSRVCAGVCDVRCVNCAVRVWRSTRLGTGEIVSSGELEILSRVLVRVLGAALHLGCTPPELHVMLERDILIH